MVYSVVATSGVLSASFPRLSCCRADSQNQSSGEFIVAKLHPFPQSIAEMTDFNMP